MTEPDISTYPLWGSALVFKTLRCKLDQDDVAAHRRAIDSLFVQFKAATGVFERLMQGREPHRGSFCKADMAAAKAVAAGLRPGIRMAALDKVIELWSSYKATGRKTRPVDRRCTTVRLPRKEYCFVVKDPECLSTGKVASGKRPAICVMVPTPMGNIELGIMGGSHQVPVLIKGLKGEEGLIRCISELLWRGPELFIDVHIGRPLPRQVAIFPYSTRHTVTFVPVGVDLGIYNLLVAAAPGRGPKGVLFVKGGRWRQARRRFERARSVKKAARRDDKWAAMRTDERNFVRDMAHKAARELIGMVRRISAVDHTELPVLVLEDIWFEDASRKGGVPDGAKLAKNQKQELLAWPFAMLRDIVIGKAAWEGIAVMLVPPKGTSVECPRCGSRDAIRRRDVHRLVCPDCAYRANDDYCAALNIARRGLERMMKDKGTLLQERSEHVPQLLDPSHTLRGASGPQDKGVVDAS